jgi:hypothetical protein
MRAAGDGKRLSAACLTVCKDCGIVARQCVLYRGFGDLLEDVFLLRCESEEAIEAEVVLVPGVVWPEQISRLWRNVEPDCAVLFVKGEKAGRLRSKAKETGSCYESRALAGVCAAIFGLDHAKIHETKAIR